MGETTEAEAIKILEQNDAKFKANLGYRGYSDMPVIRINNYKYLLVINKNAPSNATLRFIDNKLYQISFNWLQKSDSFTDAVIDRLKIKYKRGPRHVSASLEAIIHRTDENINKDHFWLNPQRHITVTNYNWVNTELTYNDSKLLDKADKNKIVMDELIEKKEKEGKRKEADQL